MNYRWRIEQAVVLIKPIDLNNNNPFNEKKWDWIEESINSYFKNITL